MEDKENLNNQEVEKEKEKENNVIDESKNNADENDYFKTPIGVKSVFEKSKDNKTSEAGSDKTEQPDKDENKNQDSKNTDTAKKSGDNEKSLFELFKEHSKKIEGVNIEKFKDEKEFVKSFAELNKKFTQLSQENSELKKKSGIEKDDSENLNQSEDTNKKNETAESLKQDFQTALENYDYENASKIFEKLNSKIEKLEAFEQKFSVAEKEKLEKQQKEEAENYRQDVVENTFEEFCKKNNIPENEKDDIRDFMRGEGKFVDKNTNSILRKLLLKNVDENTKDEYSEEVKSAFELAHTFIQAENEKSRAKEAQKKLDAAAGKIKSGQAVLQPKGVTNPPKKNVEKDWFKT